MSTAPDLRAAVAKELGWKRHTYPKTYRQGGKSHPHASHWLNDRPDVSMVSPDGWSSPPPAFDTDLNACHEFEKTLTGDEPGRYFHEMRTLVDSIERKDDEPVTIERFYIHATAEQRCRAFLRTRGRIEGREQ